MVISVLRWNMGILDHFLDFFFDFLFAFVTALQRVNVVNVDAEGRFTLLHEFEFRLADKHDVGA